MGLSRLELLMARRQIEAMILADPEMIPFQRTTLVKQGDNSWVETGPTPIKPQQVCFIPFKRRLVEGIEGSEFGEIPNQPWVLLGRWNLDIERNDSFTWQGDEYNVVELDIKKQIHKIAHIDFKGKPNHG